MSPVALVVCVRVCMCAHVRLRTCVCLLGSTFYIFRKVKFKSMGKMVAEMTIA